MPDLWQVPPPRSAACPNCGHEYPKTTSVKKKIVKKVVKQRPAAAVDAPSGAEPLDAGIELVAACRGDVAAARRVLDTIETIRKL